jgi:hypothetical protein
LQFNNIIVVTHAANCVDYHFSLIAVDGITLMTKPWHGLPRIHLQEPGGCMPL